MKQVNPQTQHWAIREISTGRAYVATKTSNVSVPQPDEPEIDAGAAVHISNLLLGVEMPFVKARIPPMQF